MSRALGRLLVFSGLVLVALPVSAEPVSVGVIPHAPIHGELPRARGEKAARLLLEELTADSRFKAVEITDPTGGPKQKSGDADIARARKEVDGAIAQFKSADNLASRRRMTQALRTYDLATRRFLANFHGAEDFKALSEAYLQFAITRFKMGAEKDSAKLLENLVRLDPYRVLEAPEVPPVFAKFHAEQREMLLEQARGRVRITSHPSNATVTFDGRDLGATPIVLRDVLPGEHYVRVNIPGGGAHWQQVQVTGGEEVSLDVQLGEEATGPYADVQRALANNSLSATALALARNLGRDAGAKYVLLGAMQGETDGIRTGTLAVRVEDGAIAPLREIRFDLEMLGGNIEIFNLVSDLGDKLQKFPGKVPTDAVALLGRVRAKATETVTEARVAPLAGGAAAQDSVAGRRRPVGPVGPGGNGEARRPVVAAQDTADPTGPARSLRNRGRIGETAPETVRADQVPEEDRKVDLAPVARPEGAVALTPEELKRLHEVESGSRKSRTGQIALWGGVGVGAAVLATGAYFLLAPSSPTSATAHISWNP